MTSLGVTSKLNPDWRFLQELRDVGRTCASKWLDEHFEDVGVRSSTDIKSSFL
jgi:NTE family protein